MDCALKQFTMKHIQVNQLLYNDPFISLKILPAVLHVYNVRINVLICFITGKCLAVFWMFF